MKMSKEHFQMLRDGIIDYIIHKRLFEMNTFASSDMWAIYNAVHDDLIYDDGHPRYKIRGRIIAHNNTFRNGFDYKDSHIETALNTIFEEINSFSYITSEVVAKSPFLMDDVKREVRLLLERTDIRVGFADISYWSSFKEGADHKIVLSCPPSRDYQKIFNMYMRKLCELCVVYKKIHSQEN